MKINKKSVIISAVIVVAIVIVSIVVITIKSKSNKIALNSNLQKGKGYVIKQEIKEGPIKTDDIKVDNKFAVSSVEKKGATLTVVVNADITNSDQAYNISNAMDTSIGDMNKDKIKTDEIKKVQIILEGKSKNWMYVSGSNSINQIEMN
jgi:hypothetical protein